MKRILALLLALTMIVSLTACGMGKAPSDPSHLKVGSYELNYKGGCIMTDENGSDALVLTLDFTNNSRDDVSYFWAITCKAFQKGMQLENASVFIGEGFWDRVTDEQYTEIQPGATIEIRAAYVLLDPEQPVEITFRPIFEHQKSKLSVDPSALSREEPVRNEAEPVPSTEPAPEPGPDPSETNPTADPVLDWWNGEWYGWWVIYDTDGEYEEYEGYWWDACAIIDVDSSYTGSVEIWDQDGSRDTNTIGYATVSLDSDDASNHGTMYSEGGWFMNTDLAYGDWIVDPGQMNYEDMICFSGTYAGEDGSYSYDVYFRPWGTMWDDVYANYPEDVPYFYFDWYLPLIQAGQSMPDEIGGDVSEFVPEIPNHSSEPSEP